MSTVSRDWRMVLPWFQSENTEHVAAGTRFYGFVDYHVAPQGTKVRLGRRNGIGQLLIKHGESWYPDGIRDSISFTAYGMENRVSHVE